MRSLVKSQPGNIRLCCVQGLFSKLRCAFMLYEQVFKRVKSARLLKPRLKSRSSSLATVLMLFCLVGKTEKVKTPSRKWRDSEIYVKRNGCRRSPNVKAKMSIKKRGKTDIQSESLWRWEMYEKKKLVYFLPFSVVESIFFLHGNRLSIHQGVALVRQTSSADTWEGRGYFSWVRAIFQVSPVEKSCFSFSVVNRDVIRGEEMNQSCWEKIKMSE